MKNSLSTRNILILAVVAICSFPATGAPFTYFPQISPTPIKDAEQRYSDFLYHYRLAGTKDFVVVKPTSIKRTGDGSVEAKFKVVLQDVVPNGIYEFFYSYSKDGKEVPHELNRLTLISTK